MFDNLLKPGQVGKLKIKNRMKFAPTVTNYCAADGSVTEQEIAYFAERAKGGAGIVTAEGSFPHLIGKCYYHQMGVHDDKMIPGLSKLARAIKDNGAVAVCQILHGGRYAHPHEYGVAGEALGPSAMKSTVRRFGQCREMTKDEIKEHINIYAQGARRIKEAGFDGIELRAHGGYLDGSFLSPWANKRTDEYGGSLENRARFAIEQVQAVRKMVGPDYPIFFRLNGTELLDGGSTEEDMRKVARWLEDAGIDALGVTVGWHESNRPSVTHEIPEGHWLYLAAEMQKVVGVPILMAYNLHLPETADKAIADGILDIWEMARPMIADPHLPRKVIEGRPEDINPCITCNQACFPNILDDMDMGCAVNPVVGKEWDPAYQIKPAPKPRKVFVIGGGPAGLTAARVAAQRGHKVTLFEKGNKLGGALLIASVPPFKYHIDLLTKYLVRQVEKSGVEVKVRKSVTARAVEKEKPDAVIVAAGMVPFIPDMPGVDRSNVVQANEVLRGTKKVGKDVVIVGGELVGCETAEFLADMGKKVTVVRRGKSMATKVSPLHRFGLLGRLTKKGVTLVPGVQKYDRITDDGLTLTDGEGKSRTFKADTVVIAAGGKENTALAKELEGKVPIVRAVGDCVEGRTIQEAIGEGYKAGLEI